MLFSIVVTERLEKVVEVQAESLEEAIFKVEEAVAKEEIVLGAEDFVGRDIVPQDKDM